jgi:hypothetical protein
MNKIITQGILKPAQRVKVKNYTLTWANHFARVTGLFLAIAAMIMLSGCVSDADLNKCMEKHSRAVCLNTLGG